MWGFYQCPSFLSGLGELQISSSPKFYIFSGVMCYLPNPEIDFIFLTGDAVYWTILEDNVSPSLVSFLSGISLNVQNINEDLSSSKLFALYSKRSLNY